MAQAMTRRTRERDGHEQQNDSEQPRTATYVYGIVPGDVETSPDVAGIGGAVDTVRHGDIAALVSGIGVDRPLGTPEDLTTHARILDATTAEVPVLPLRFGAVVADQDAVARELLAPHHDEFTAALAELDGKAQYLVKGRYDEQAILSEILSESDRARRLRAAVRERPEAASRQERMALGELIAEAIAAKRDEDTTTAVTALRGSISGDDPIIIREPTHERDAVYVACLTELSIQEELERLVEELSQRWAGRIELRLLGPLAPYDFVVTDG